MNYEKIELDFSEIPREHQDTIILSVLRRIFTDEEYEYALKAYEDMCEEYEYGTDKQMSSDDMVNAVGELVFNAHMIHSIDVAYEHVNKTKNNTEEKNE